MSYSDKILIMLIAKKMTPDNFPSFIGHPRDMLASWAILVQDGGTKMWPKGRRKIYMVTRCRDFYAVIDEDGIVTLTGRSIGELVRAHSDSFTFYFLEITDR
jgi:hypothetical protein